MIPFITHIIIPKPSNIMNIDPKLLIKKTNFQKQLPKNTPPSKRLKKNHILTLIIDTLDIAYLTIYFNEHNFNITINTVNLIFIITNLLLHKTPITYIHTINATTHNTTDILIQFPFYTKIQLIIKHSNLNKLITEFFINITNKNTFPIITFFNSTLINFTVPSNDDH